MSKSLTYALVGLLVVLGIVALFVFIGGMAYKRGAEDGAAAKKEPAPVPQKVYIGTPWRSPYMQGFHRVCPPPVPATPATTTPPTPPTT